MLNKRLTQYRSAAELKISEANKAIESDDLELAASLQAEADSLLEKAETVKSQIARTKRAEDLEDKQAAEVAPAKSKEPVRLPFADGDDEPEESAKKDFGKAVYTLRYGDDGDATKAVISDLYGKDYGEKRAAQMDAFSKYVRHGRLDHASEEDLLKTVILRPESVAQDIKGGYSVASIKVNLQEMVNDLGGYLVPEDYRTEIIKRMMGMTAVRSRARKVSTNRDAVEWPRLEGGNSQYTSAVRVTWVDEIPSSATVAQTNPTFGMSRIPVHTTMARTDISRNQLEDSAFNVLDLLATLFAEAFAIDEDNEFLTGTGGGRPKGILGNRSGAEATPEAGIAAVVSGAAATLTADGIYDLCYGLQSQYRRNAVFCGARLTHAAIRKMKDGESRPLWEPSMQAGEPAMLLGSPFLETESVPAIAANAYPLIFGDLSGYLVVDRVGMALERVDDTTTAGQNKTAFFARRRVGGAVIEPWKFQAQKVAAS